MDFPELPSYPEADMPLGASLPQQWVPMPGTGAHTGSGQLSGLSPHCALSDTCTLVGT